MKKIYCWLLCWAICLLAAACSGPTASSENGDGPVVLPTAVLEEKQMVAVADTCEFYVEHAMITDDVVPPAADSFYSHYEAEAGKVYVDFCLAYKNLKSKGVDADGVLSAKLIYQGKYEYSGFSMIEEDGRSDFTYYNITSISPLATEYVHYLFQVPEQVKTEGGSLEIHFTVGGNTYLYRADR